MVVMSLSSKAGRFDFFPDFTWNFENYRIALTKFRPQFIRSFSYAAIATLLTVVIGYPLAYFIAFRGGKYRNILLGLVVVPFFTSYLIRTLAWNNILADEGPFGLGVPGLDRVVAVVAELPARRDGRLLAHDAIPLDDQGGAVPVGHHPLATPDRDGARSLVVDREEVDEGMRGFRGEVRIPVVGHLVDGDPEAWEFLSGSLHVTQDKRAWPTYGSHKWGNRRAYRPSLLAPWGGRPLMRFGCPPSPIASATSGASR